MEHKIVEEAQALISPPTIHGDRKALELSVGLTKERNMEAKLDAALSYDDEESDSNCCKDEQGSAASIYELAAFLVIGGLCAIFRNYWF
jgi:hypothetical protein